MQSTQSSVICWWETGATSLPRELPTWSLLTTPSQGISWLNRPHTRLTHARPRTQSSDFDKVLFHNRAWSLSLDQGLGSLLCYACGTHQRQNKRPGAQKRSMVRHGTKKKSLMWDVFNVAFTRVLNTVKPFLSYFHVVAGRGSEPGRVSQLFSPAHAGFLFIIMDQTEVSVGRLFHESIPRGSCGLSGDIFPE